MKKGNILTTLCMLVITVACLTFGVFAVISTTFSATGTITFNAYGLDIDIEVSATGTSSAFTTLYYSTTPLRDKHSTSGKSWNTINASTPISGLSLDFDELGEGTILDTQLKMKITNYSDYAIKATATATAVAGIDTSVENVAYIYKNVTETMAENQTAPEAHSDTVVVHFTPTSSSTAASGTFNVNVVIEPSEYQEDDPSTYVMSGTEIQGYTGTKDYLVIPRVVNGYNVESVIQAGEYMDSVVAYNDGPVTNNTIDCWTEDWSSDFGGDYYYFNLEPDGFTVGGDDTTLGSGSMQYYSQFQLNKDLSTLILPSGLSIPEGAFSLGSGNTEEFGSIQNCTYTGTWTESEPPTLLGQLNLEDYTDGDFYGYGFYDTVNNFASLSKIIFTSGYSEINYFNIFGYFGARAEIALPYGVTSIVASDQRLTKINIPNTVTSIVNSAFLNCANLTSITIPSSVTSIGNSAFLNCANLTSITIPSSVTSIGNSAFSYCSNLSSITIPNSVTSIGNSAFSYCSNLSSITIPNSVISIGDDAFKRCSSLTSITVESGNTKYDSRDNCNAIIEKSSNTLISGCQNTVIPDSVTSIGNWAFNGCSNLSSITIPNSVKSIGNYAFSDCSALNSAEFENTTGWKVGYSPTNCNTPVTISTTDFSANATLLKSTHAYKYWKRG